MTDHDDSSKPRIVVALDLTHVHRRQRVGLIGVRRWQERQRRLSELLGVAAVCFMPQACGDGPATTATNAAGGNASLATGGASDGLGGALASTGGSTSATGGADGTPTGGVSTGGAATGGTPAAVDAPPWVASSLPVTGAVIGRRPSSIQLVFSEPMDRTSVEQSITIAPSVAFEVRWDATGTTAELTGVGGAALELSAATDYVVTIGPGAKDAGGLGLDGNHDGVAGDPYGLTLRTEGPPKVTSTWPSEGATGVNSGVTTSVSVTFRFDVPMVPSTVSYSVSFTPTSGITTTQTATWSDGNKLLTLAGFLLVGKQYTITIAGTSTSQDGQTLDGNRDGVGGDPFTLHFSTSGGTTCSCQVDNPSCPLDIFCSSDLGCPLDTGCPADGCLCEVQCACQLDL